VAVVLASLVGTMTVSAAVLLLMEGGALGTGNVRPGWAANQTVGAQVDVANPLRKDAWNFIIIYESGDVAARAETLADGQVAGAPSPTPVRPRANFHFVIDSAKSGTMDGALETGTSWKNQTSGAYAGWPVTRSHPFSTYNTAVGICLAGDLSREPISEAQQQTLIQLVHEIQQRTQIPTENIKFQWDLEGVASPAQKEFAMRIKAAL